MVLFSVWHKSLVCCLLPVLELRKVNGHNSMEESNFKSALKRKQI